MNAPERSVAPGTAGDPAPATGSGRITAGSAGPAAAGPAAAGSADSSPGKETGASRPGKDGSGAGGTRTGGSGAGGAHPGRARTDGSGAGGVSYGADEEYADPARSYYVRLLRLRHVEPVGWQRILVAEGSVVVAVLIALADLASVWVVLVLPLVAAAMVVLHDRVQGLLDAPGAASTERVPDEHTPDRRA